MAFSSPEVPDAVYRQQTGTAFPVQMLWGLELLPQLPSSITACASLLLSVVEWPQRMPYKEMLAVWAQLAAVSQELGVVGLALGATLGGFQ